MSNYTTNMVEIFSSIQGEGKHVGLRQIFLRFHGCDLDCHYCDSRVTLNKSNPEFCQTEKYPGRQDFMQVKNPISLEFILNLVTKWVSLMPNAHHSVSITGGEPLLQIDTLLDFLPSLRRILPIYLETNGIHHQEVSKCINHLDYISMDFKLPSTTKSRPYWEEHRKFLEIAANKDVYVKTVISEETPISEIRNTAKVIATIDESVPLILQPMTTADARQNISTNSLFILQEEASKYLKEVRIIPQTHKFMQLL